MHLLMKGLGQFLILWFFVGLASAQDPAYTSFSNNRALFNPSLVGSHGAQSWSARAKGQWLNDGGHGYKTLSLLWEETVPCSILDVGVKMNFNEEGQGLYRTFETGLLAAVFIPIHLGTFSDHNIRIGSDFSWGVNSIDYDRLIWSDQLDPKYGIVRPTTFAAPNGGRSAWYFNPGFGASLRSIWNKKSFHAVTTNFGAAMYRFYSINNGEINQSVSLLGLKTDNPVRYTFFGEAEFIPIAYERQYFTLRPSALYQRQGKINYAELGARIGYSRKAGLGVYYHTSLGNEYGETRWLSMSTDFQIAVARGKMMEVNMSYSENIGGLQNFTGPLFEIGFTYHLAKSSLCNLLGMEDDVPYENSYRCPIMALTPGKRKMYENIWDRN